MAISTYVAVPTLAVGDKLTAARFNTIVTALNFLLNPPEAVATNTAGTSYASTTADAVVPFASETRDTGPSWDGAMHDNTTNNSRITFTTAGTYTIRGLLVWSANGTGRRNANLRKNANAVSGGGTLLRAYSVPPTAADFCYMPIEWEDTFSAGDYIELFGAQTSGGALTLTTTVPSYLGARLAGS